MVGAGHGRTTVDRWDGGVTIPSLIILYIRSELSKVKTDKINYTIASVACKRSQGNKCHVNKIPYGRDMFFKNKSNPPIFVFGKYLRRPCCRRRRSIEFEFSGPRSTTCCPSSTLTNNYIIFSIYLPIESMVLLGNLSA